MIQRLGQPVGCRSNEDGRVVFAVVAQLTSGTASKACLVREPIDYRGGLNRAQIDLELNELDPTVMLGELGAHGREGVR